MAAFLEKYLQMGLSRIVVTHYNLEESGNGRIEQADESIVAFDGKKFVEVHATAKTNYWPNGGSDFSTSTPKEISEAHYDKLATGKEISDSPPVLKRLEQEKKASQQRKVASNQLQLTAPKCPKCGGAMTPRKGPRGRFWGCKNYPECKSTSNFTAEHMRLYEAASRLV